MLLQAVPMVVVIFGLVLAVGLTLAVVAVVRRVRNQQAEGFQAFNILLILGIALIVGGFTGLQRSH